MRARTQIALLLTVWLMLLSTAARAEKTTVKLADGVYAHDAPGPEVNSGVVVGSRGIFVFNCDLKLYKELMALVREVSGGQAVKFLGNGHAAGDDVGCNGQFEDMGATIVGSQAMYNDFVAKATRMKEGLERRGGRLVYPHVSFENWLVLDLGSHKVHLIYMGKGHTEGDTVAYLPKEKVLYSTDLVFHENHPTVTEADTVNWQRILAKFRTWEIDALVPGHGPVVQGRENALKAIDALDAYFSDLRGQVQTLMAAGKKLPEIQEAVDVKKYASWGRKEVLPATVKKLYTELGGKE